MALTMNAMGPGLVRIDPAARDWKLTLVRGAAALAFGILCFVWPAISLFALVLLWGVYALVDGISAILWGTRSRWGSMMAVGVVSVVAGLVAFFWPDITALALLYVIAAWAVVRGAVEIASALQLRRRIENEWILIVGGLLSILFGVLVALFPGAGALSLVWLIGAFAAVFGILAIMLALRLRALQREWSLRREETPVAALSAERLPEEHLR